MAVPRVSIMVISYNQEHVIGECLRSCLEQTYNDYEIVVSDDASTDGTVGVVRELERASGGKLRLIANSQNGGITRNCNIALQACRGELIAITGGDDVLYPRKLEAQVLAMDSEPGAVLCYHAYHVLTEVGITATGGHRRRDIIRDHYDLVSNYGAGIPGPVPMFRRLAVPARGFDERIPTASDWKFYVEVAAKGCVVRVKEVLAAYRKHSGNVGKRVHEYEADFLRTVELLKLEFGDVRFSAAADAGARRFLLGAMYRALSSGDLERLDGYIATYREHGGRLDFLVRAVSRVPGGGAVLRRLRGSLKQYV